MKTVRDRLTALVLDNTNIRAACDDLRRQCHSQGVAFGDLLRLVKQSREDQEEIRADAWEETRPHPWIRPELLDGGGNLRARDIGITWQDGDTFLHGVRITGQRDDMEDNRRRPATAALYPPCPEGGIWRLVATGEAVTGGPGGNQSGCMGGDQTAPLDPTRVVRWRR